MHHIDLWVKKTLGNEHRMALGAEIGAAVGPLIGGLLGGAVFGTQGAIIGAITGPVLGHFSGSIIDPLLNRFSNIKALARMKLEQEFSGSYLYHQYDVEQAIAKSNERIATLVKLRQARLREGVAEGEKPFIPTRSHLTHPTKSNQPDDKELQQKAASLKKAFSSATPIVINTACINISVIAVLLSLAAHYELDIKINYDDINGAHQTRSISSDPEEQVDYTIIPEGPLFLAGDNKAFNYRKLFPVFAEQQRLLTKGETTDKPREMHIFSQSSAEEQYLIQENVSPNVSPTYFNNLNEIILRVESMRSGDSMILWEPLATSVGRRFKLKLSKEIYKVWFGLYCHKRWRAGGLRKAKADFATLFIDEWRYCNSNRKETADLVLNDKEYLKAFAKGGTPTTTLYML